MIVKAAVLGIALGLASPPALAAQSLPQWSLEAVVGSGRHNDRAGAIYFRDDRSQVVRVAFDYRLGGAALVAPYVTAEYSVPGNGDQIANCLPAPNGTCRQYFDGNGGGGIGVGARGGVARKAVLGGLVGIGRYDDRIRRFVEAEAMLRLGRHAGVVGTARYESWSRDGTSYWFVPLSLGLQIF